MSNHLRFVDDCFTVFSSGSDHTSFLNALNQYHPNMKFTVEIGNEKLSFLDTHISIENGKFESWVFRKATNTGVVLNFCAVCPDQWKKGLIQCFLHRAWTVCSSYVLLHQEIEKLKTMFTSNGYPLQFIEGIVSKFLHDKLNPTRKPIDDEVEKRFILRIPFVGKASLEFKKRITDIVKDDYKVNFSCVFVPSKVKDYFSLKCRSPTFLQSNVVYKFSCKDDPSIFYIGETQRHIGIRAMEHFKLTGLSSAVGNHVKDCAGCKSSLDSGDLTFKDFEIIKSGRSKLDIEVAESILVRRHNPPLNKQLFKAGCPFTCRIFI